MCSSDLFPSHDTEKKAAEMKAAEMKAAEMKAAEPKVYTVLNKGDKTPFKTRRYAYKHYYQVGNKAF